MATLTGRCAAEVMRHLVDHAAHGYTQGGGRFGNGTQESVEYEGFAFRFPGGDADCSSGVKRAWDAVGKVADVDFTAWASCTGDMREALLSTGLWEVWPLGWRAEVCPGDLYLCDSAYSAGHGHVAMAYDKATLCEFNMNEWGGATGGQVGDQTGNESVHRDYYVYKYGWDCILHYCGPDYLAEMRDEMSKEDVAAINNRLDAINGGVGNIESALATVLAKLNAPTLVAPFGGDVYRLCNTATGVHVFTNSPTRRDDLAGHGWTNEGAKFALGTAGDPIWELVNPYSDDCILTTNLAEVEQLAKLGWQSIGVIGTAGEGAEVHRLGNTVNGMHLYTTDANEVSVLQSSGWTDEGVAFRAE